MTMRSFARWLVLLLGLLVAGGVAGAAESKPWLVENDTVRLLRISGHGYAVPLGYPDAPLESGLDQDGLFLMMLWPGLEPKTRENIREFTHVPGWGRRVSLLIQQNRFGSSEQALLRIALQSATWPGHYLKPIDLAYGLQRFEFVYTTARRTETFDFFLDDSPDSATLFIRCSRSESVPKPGCELVFTHVGVGMKINFERPHMSEWQTIQAAVLQLLARFSAEYERLQQRE